MADTLRHDYDSLTKIEDEENLEVMVYSTMWKRLSRRPQGETKSSIHFSQKGFPHSCWDQSLG